MKENVRNVSEKKENMRLKCEFKNKKKRLQTLYITGDFNWLKACELKTKIEWKTIENYRTFYAIKNFIVFFCIYKMYLISAK